MLNDKCAKNHLKMRSFDRLKKLLKLLKKLKKQVIKFVLALEGVEPTPSCLQVKRITTGPRAHGDNIMHALIYI